LKKRSKNFSSWRTRPISNWAAYAKEQKFFGSFFKKEHLLSLIANRYTGAASEQYPTANNRISAEPFGWLGATSATRPAL
jgi:hypothetical protein